MRRVVSSVLVLAASCVAVPVLAASAPTLGAAATFAVLGSSTVTNTGATAVTGDLGVSPGSAITGFPPGTVTGLISVNGPAVAAQASATTAYNNLAGQTCTTPGMNNLTGTLGAGVYCSASSMALAGTLTLDANNDPNAVFVFQAATTLTLASNAQVVVINGGQSCNVFWQVGSSATLGTGSALRGSILANTSVTLTTGSSIAGRALALNGAVTLDTNVVSVCSLVPTLAPTLSKSFSPSTITAGGTSTLTITLNNANSTPATLSSALVDTLPAGMVIASIPNVITTCTGVGTPVAAAASGTASLPAGRSIPANGSCTLAVAVASNAVGSYNNIISTDSLVTDRGNNASPANAILTVIAVLASDVNGIPTLSEWAMILLVLVMSAVGVNAVRRRDQNR